MEPQWAAASAGPGMAYADGRERSDPDDRIQP
jgi:hypothetical protein